MRLPCLVKQSPPFMEREVFTTGRKSPLSYHREILFNPPPPPHPISLRPILVVSYLLPPGIPDGHFPLGLSTKTLPLTCAPRATVRELQITRLIK